MWKYIAGTALLAGTLDIAAAFLQAWRMSGTTPVRVLRFIASGVMGKSAFSGGPEMPVLQLPN
jgi:hypothetical protein